MEPFDSREQSFLDTLDSIGVKVFDPDERPEGRGYALERVGRRSDVFVSEGWAPAEAGVQSCRDLMVEPMAFYALLHNRELRGL